MNEEGEEVEITHTVHPNQQALMTYQQQDGTVAQSTLGRLSRNKVEEKRVFIIDSKRILFISIRCNEGGKALFI